MKIIKLFLTFFLILTINPSTSFSARDTNSFDGNIFPIYAGNGSLVPPQSSLKNSLNQQRCSVLIFYLDDNSNSKLYAPVVSGIDLVWGKAIDIIPIATDEIQSKQKYDSNEEGYYWNGKVPQTVVINGSGEVVLDEYGQTDLKLINKAIASATGIKEPEVNIEIKTFNEYNSEPSREGYIDPR